MSVKTDSSIRFSCGLEMKNRFGLAPMTNCQSHENGQLSDDEFTWLRKRAEGGFGLTMTCASHIQAIGKGFPGQLGVFSDDLMDGHKRLTKSIQEYGSLAVIQLHHAGMRSPKELIGEAPVCPSDSEKHGARALTLEEVHQLRDDFIEAAVRSQKCGYNGVEIHGAHGYILAQFLSKKINHRTDEYGGSYENRTRLIVEIIDGIRDKCGSKFLLGLRLSPERFGMELAETKAFCEQLIAAKQLDFLDISLWDSFKMPEEEEHQDKSLLQHFTDLDFGNTKLTVAGKIMTAKNVQDLLDAGVDFVSIGRGAILHHDFPKQVIENPSFVSVSLPVTREHLAKEALGEKFINYMSGWPDFVVK